MVVHVYQKREVVIGYLEWITGRLTQNRCNIFCIMDFLSPVCRIEPH